MNVVIYNMTPFRSYENRRFGGKYLLHHQGEIVSDLGTTLAVTST
jgi:hypothetical protein